MSDFRELHYSDNKEVLDCPNILPSSTSSLVTLDLMMEENSKLISLDFK